MRMQDGPGEERFRAPQTPYVLICGPCFLTGSVFIQRPRYSRMGFVIMTGQGSLYKRTVNIPFGHGAQRSARVTLVTAHLWMGSCTRAC